MSLLKVFQHLTEDLSIKQIVIAGVVIMGIVIAIFSITMIFFTSTVKFDKQTLTTIIIIEEQNHKNIKNTKIINDLNTKILLSKSVQDLEKLQLPNISVDYEYLEIDVKDKDLYNTKVDQLHALIEKKVLIQKELYTKKLRILKINKQLQDNILDIQKSISSIEVITDSLSGKVLLKNKRLLRELKVKNPTTISFTQNNSIYKEIEDIQALTKNLYIHILKIPIQLNQIINSDDRYIIEHLDKNILFQENYLIETLYNNLLQKKEFQLNHKKDLLSFDKHFNSIKEKESLIISLKKNSINKNIDINNLLKQKKDLELEVFDIINSIDTISKNIKFSILNNSDDTARQITFVVILVSILSTILLVIAAIILIARINVPLDFITKFIKEIGTKNKKLSSKLPISINDEFGQLSNSFNKMTSTIEKNIHEIEDLYTEIENTQKEIIFTMGTAGELRSKETGQHVKRVAEYSKLLALLYGLNEEEAELIKLASPMHDIGKVGIPDAILHKPGKLTVDEFKIMKTHAQLGHSMLGDSNRIILKSASIVAHQHHEKYNGKGYPQGLKGEDIHIFGRITAVADVFDALGSERAYKKAWPDEKILELFEREKGEHFDPKLIDLFVQNKKKFYKIRDMYKEEF